MSCRPDAVAAETTGRITGSTIRPVPGVASAAGGRGEQFMIPRLEAGRREFDGLPFESIIFSRASVIFWHISGVALLEADAVVLAAVGDHGPDELELALVQQLRLRNGGIVLSVVSASTVPFASSSTPRIRCQHSCSCVSGYFSLIFCAGVRPLTEQNFLPTDLSAPVGTPSPRCARRSGRR